MVLCCSVLPRLRRGAAIAAGVMLVMTSTGCSAVGQIAAAPFHVAGATLDLAGKTANVAGKTIDIMGKQQKFTMDRIEQGVDIAGGAVRVVGGIVDLVKDIGDDGDNAQSGQRSTLNAQGWPSPGFPSVSLSFVRSPFAAHLPVDHLQSLAQRRLRLLQFVVLGQCLVEVIQREAS